MRCRIMFGVVTVLLLTALGHAQTAEFKVKEESLDGEFRDVRRYDWVAVKSQLHINIPGNWVVKYSVIDKDGAVRKTGEYTASVEHPVSSKADPQGFGAAGDTLYINAYEKNPDPGQPPLKSESLEAKIVKEGFVAHPSDAFAFTPVVMYEFGKKENPAGGETTDVAPGIGALYLFTVRDVERKWLTQFPFGINVSYADSRVLKEGEKALESSGVISGGLAVGWKPSREYGFLILVTGGLANFLGDDRYYYVGGGFGHFIMAK